MLSPRERRLLAEIEAQRAWIQQRIDATGADVTHGAPGWEDDALELLEKAKSVAETDIHAGWRFLHDALRMEYAGFSDEGLDAVMLVLANEAPAVLKPSQVRAIDQLLTKAREAKTKEARVSYVQQAMAVRDGEMWSRHYKGDVLSNQMVIALSALVLGLAGILIGTTVGLVPQLDAPKMDGTAAYYSVMMFGLVGAAASAGQSLSKTEAVGRIPELVGRNYVTILRVLVGAALAVAAYVAVVGRVAEGLFAEAAGEWNNATILAAAFISGWTERLVVHIGPWKGSRTSETVGKAARPRLLGRRPLPTDALRLGRKDL